MTELLRQLIEAAARERFNDGAALVLQATLKATENKQMTITENRSGTSFLALNSPYLADLPFLWTKTPLQLPI
jgi:DNA-directed RNA polymerase III subunit RPC3